MTHISLQVLAGICNKLWVCARSCSSGKAVAYRDRHLIPVDRALFSELGRCW